MIKCLRRWRTEMIVMAAYLCLTVAMTWPLALRLNTHFAGQDIDVWINTWVTWWTHKALSEGQSLYYTNLMFYPHGVSLTFHSFSHVNTALALLLQPWMGKLGAHNTTTLLTHALSGYGMFCLVRYVARSSLGAFFAGLVFAFFPYRMAESIHPVIVSTQWIPLYFLFLIRLVWERRKRDVIPAAIFFVLTALSSWHLMIFTLLLSAAYVCYLVAFERWRCSKTMMLNLVLLAGLACVILAPILYPIIREQLTTSHSYVGVSLEKGRGNDLIAFILPAEEHPVWGKLVKAVHERVRTKRSAYLGITVIGLSVAAALANWKRARFWILATLLSVLFSIGPYIQINGHTFDILAPWSLPIVWLLRYPFRFNVLIGLTLAVASGLGLSALLHRLAANQIRKRWLLAGAMMALLMFEYLCFPFPTTAAVIPDYYVNLAALPGDGAIMELPMGRQRSKLYMYYQTVHSRPVVEGHISRTSIEAYRFIEATPALRSFRACRDWTLPPADLSPLLSDLGEQGIEYVIMHKQLVTKPALDLWLDTRTVAPDYENEHIAVYNTKTASVSSTGQAQLLESCIAVRPLLANSISALPGDIIEIPLEWIAGHTPRQDYVLELSLTGEAEKIHQRHRYQVVDGSTVAGWPMTSRRVISYSLPVSLSLTPGLYHLQAALVPEESEQDNFLSAHLLDIQVLDRPQDATPPAVNATFGADLRLYGYDLEVDHDAIHTTLYWQSLRQIDVDYKFFLHLYDAEGNLAAQADVMPRDWAYPTSWWMIEEMVSDKITLFLEGVPPGTYRLGIGVYNPYTGERLTITDHPPDLTANEGRLILPEEVVR